MRKEEFSGLEILIIEGKLCHLQRGKHGSMFRSEDKELSLGNIKFKLLGADPGGRVLEVTMT